MAYLFTPPGRVETAIFPGTCSLRYSYPVSFTVYKLDGVWTAQETPATETLLAADELLAVSGRPQIITDAQAAELIAAGVGTCEHIEN